MPHFHTALPRRAALITLLIGLSGAAFSTAWASTTDAQFMPAFQTFVAAQKGDSGAVERAVEQFDALLKADPGHPLLMAYAGAATAMRAKSTLLPWKKISHAEDGLAQIDKALALLTPAHEAERVNHVPVSLQTRFVAASTFNSLPAFFNRGPRGAKLLAEVQASPLFAASPAGFQGAVLMASAQLAAGEHRAADARRDLTTVIDRNMPQADAARAQLQALPQ